MNREFKRQTNWRIILHCTLTNKLTALKDLCATSRDVMTQTEEQVQDIQSVLTSSRHTG